MLFRATLFLLCGFPGLVSRVLIVAESHSISAEHHEASCLDLRSWARYNATAGGQEVWVNDKGEGCGGAECNDVQEAHRNGTEPASNRACCRCGGGIRSDVAENGPILFEACGLPLDENVCHISEVAPYALSHPADLCYQLSLALVKRNPSVFFFRISHVKDEPFPEKYNIELYTFGKVLLESVASGCKECTIGLLSKCPVDAAEMSGSSIVLATTLSILGCVLLSCAVICAVRATHREEEQGLATALSFRKERPTATRSELPITLEPNASSKCLLDSLSL